MGTQKAQGAITKKKIKEKSGLHLQTVSKLTTTDHQHIGCTQVLYDWLQHK
jgi:hypothetical protein